MQLRRIISLQYTHISLWVASFWICIFVNVCLPRVRRDGSLWYSCPNGAVDRPGTTPEMSASKGGGRGGSSRCCCCWVGKPWYWERQRKLFVHPLFTSRVESEENLCCLTCVEFRTVHRSNHWTQLPSSCNENNIKHMPEAMLHRKLTKPTIQLRPNRFLLMLSLFHIHCKMCSTV